MAEALEETPTKEELLPVSQEEQKPSVPATPEFNEKQLLDIVGKGYDLLNKSISRTSDIYAKHQPELEKRRTAYESEVATLQANRAQPPEVPVRPEYPQRAATVDQTQAKSLFAIASLIGGLGMAGGRGRGMLAMSAMNGALKGFKEGNEQKYKDNIDQYKAHVKEQTDAYDMMYQRYLAIFQASKLNLSEKIQLFDIETSRMQDELGHEAAQRKDIDAIIKHTMDIGKLSAQMRKQAQDASLIPFKEREMAHKERMMQSQERIAGIRENVANVNLEKSKERKQQQAKEKKDIEHLKMAIGTEQKTLDQMLREEKTHSGGMEAIFDTLTGGSQGKNRKKVIKEKQSRIAELQQKMNNLVLQTQVRDAVGNDRDIEVGEPLELP